MDEVRLKEIEKQFEYGALGTYSPDHWNLAHELITALRYEWAKRNKYIEETFANLGESEEQTEQQRERADRAEAALAQLREAAEEVIRHLGPSSNPWSNFSGEAYEAVIQLRRALDTAKDDPAP